tara:strand:- start:142 stop:267 length:126 start_codon:yes stop_codon:yes gene_type:complete
MRTIIPTIGIPTIGIPTIGIRVSGVVKYGMKGIDGREAEGV